MEVLTKRLNVFKTKNNDIKTTHYVLIFNFQKNVTYFSRIFITEIDFSPTDVLILNIRLYVGQIIRITATGNPSSISAIQLMEKCVTLVES